MPDLKTILTSFVADIEAMQQKDPNYFGPFSEGSEDYNSDGVSYTVEWPNLAIMLAEAKAVLAHEKLHEEMRNGGS